MSPPSHYTIGIDTGGTYTDAVLVDPAAREVVAFAKALTTPADLSIGIDNALAKLIERLDDKIDLQQITSVGLSTTLATNALVQGLGSSVGVVLIGFDVGMVQRSQVDKVTDTHLLTLAGGHRYTGAEAAELDTAALKQWLADQPTFDAYAVAAHYAARNPAHELQAKALIEAHTLRPVSISTALSSHLNDPARALTATLNARIIKLIGQLQTAVSASLKKLNLDAKVMVVKGDGSVVDLQTVRNQPIETILSGPAASVLGARFLIDTNDFVIVDIGGTTSDVATVKNGWPKLNEKGAKIGSFRTLVKAIDMHTTALGGDTEVQPMHNGQIQLGQRRVLPISLLAHRWPQIEKALETSLSNKKALWHAATFIVLADKAAATRQAPLLLPRDRDFLAQLDHETPKPYYQLVNSASERASLSRLRHLGLVQISGVTPSDAAHVLEQQSQWSRCAALLACKIYAEAQRKTAGRSPDDDVSLHEAARQVAQGIHDRVAEASSHLIIEQLAGQAFSPNNPLLQAVIQHQARIEDLGIQLTPQIDVVAVGGPAQVFYPAVGARLNTEVRIPAGSEVANAIGAAVSLIRLQATVEITFVEFGSYLIHADGEPIKINGGEEAIQRASDTARNQVIEKAKNMGAAKPEVEIDTHRIDLPNLQGEQRLMAATVTATLVSNIAS